MNSTERLYGERLKRKLLEGKIAKYAFEWHAIHLCDDCKYTPDYVVWAKDGFSFEYHEVKAMWGKRRVGWREDAKIKWKWARSLWPGAVFVLAALRRDGTWHLEEYNGESVTITPEERAAGRSGMHAVVARCGKVSSRRGASTRRRSGQPWTGARTSS